MTRLNPNLLPVTQDVYEASLKPLAYLGVLDEAPDFDNVAEILQKQGVAKSEGSQLVVVPEPLEELTLAAWDMHLREAFALNQARRGTEAHMPGLTVGNLVIHETFRRYSPDLRPNKPMVAALVKPGERHAPSFATYVLQQLGLALCDNSELHSYGVKTVISGIEPTLYEIEQYDPVQKRRTVSRSYDPMTGHVRKVVPVVSTTNLTGTDALTAAEPRLSVARWGQTVEQRLAPCTPEGREKLERWVGKFPATAIEEVRINPGHRAIAVLPRIVR